MPTSGPDALEAPRARKRPEQGKLVAITRRIRLLRPQKGCRWPRWAFGIESEVQARSVRKPAGERAVPPVVARPPRGSERSDGNAHDQKHGRNFRCAMPNPLCALPPSESDQGRLRIGGRRAVQPPSAQVNSRLDNACARRAAQRTIDAAERLHGRSRCPSICLVRSIQ